MAVVRECMLLLLMAAAALSIPVAKRQTAPPTCSNQQDCLPSQLGNESVPQALVQCTGGRCFCNQCFLRNVENNTCFLQPPCTNYSSSTGCADTRFSQLTAFLLSFFLSWLGAANFYIGQLGLAIPQLLIGIFMCCLGCCAGLFRSGKKDNEEVNLFKLILCCALCIPALLLPFVQLAWWIADLVIFGRNDRLDGRGCPLRPTL